MDKTTRKEAIRLSEINFLPILIGLAVIFFTIGNFSFSSKSECVCNVFFFQ